MASAPQAQGLPLFYNDLQPLSSDLHANYKIRRAETAPFLAKQHAVPLTVEEFPLVQRYLPIVFSMGDEPVPLGLMGLNEGINVFFDADGKFRENEPFYIPAYIRRYPYMLARLRPDAEELSLCFDPTSDSIGDFEEGEALFEDGKPSELVQQVLKFNEDFEIAGQKTNAFMKELKELGLLMDGEVSIQPDGAAQPYIYRGFQMIDENKLNEMRGDQLRKIVQNGMLPLIYAHLFSLNLMREIFGRQMQQGAVAQQEQPAA
ncbi:SapC family protein [Sphingomonas sp. MG17]|uniref:SapC family protein n=1 Tax=Sphingomonas tagetis TaxID=2949092 RepID=A0A9X2HNT3_9SPHN|nr:SapC family protein [Sphingomonas tagetis]MCP3732689.1 SapC family protein [Sphingomonas tagetis]